MPEEITLIHLVNLRKSVICRIYCCPCSSWAIINFWSRNAAEWIQIPEPHRSAGRWEAWFLQSRFRDPFEVICFGKEFSHLPPMCPSLSFFCISATKRGSSLEWQRSPIVPLLVLPIPVFLAFLPPPVSLKSCSCSPSWCWGFSPNFYVSFSCFATPDLDVFFITILHSSVLTSQVFLQWLFLPLYFT